MARKTPWHQTLSHLVSEHRAPPGGRRSLSPRPRTPARLAVPILAIALVAALAAGLLLLWPGQSAQADSHTIEFPENSKDQVATFTATDPEGATPIAWYIVAAGADPDDTGDLTAVDNADSDSFTIDKDGILKFSSPPDFENPATTNAADNTYKVVVVACDMALVSDACPDATAPAENAGYHAVTVKVTNEAETGEVEWGVDHDFTGTYDATAYDVTGADDPTLVQFEVGAILSVAATGGVTDGDVSGAAKDVPERLQWYRSSSKTGMGTPIKDATNPAYRVTTDDIGMYIRVEAFYNVGTGREESASLTSDYPVLRSRSSNDAPEFPSSAVTRSVAEGKKGMKVGAPVTATDDISNALNYVLGGTDVAKFKIDQKTGQITTDVDLDRETTTDADPAFGCGTGYECSVTVTATDSAGEASDAKTVTIKLTNVDEKPTFVTETTATSPKTIMRAENDTALDDTDLNVTYAATDPESQNITYSLTGPDGAKFDLSGSRVLSFRAKPDYEKPTDRDRDNVYEVAVRASDGVKYADRMVKVTVTDVDEAPKVTGKDSISYVENSKDPVATFTATDPEGATPIAWDIVTGGGDPDGTGDLAGVDNADSDSFTIDKDGVLKFAGDPPDFENPATTNATANTYKVVVVACDVALESDACPTATAPAENASYHAVTVKVTNVAETGKVVWGVDHDADTTADTPTLVQFQVGDILSASVEDGDISGADKAVGAANNLRWRWYRGSTLIRADGQPVADASYTVTTSDERQRIKVVASYTVGTGREESASLTSDYPVLRSRSSNDAPEFPSSAVTRSVAEGKKGMKVGAPVTATDDISNALNYVLGGTDVAKFKIDQKTGQITTDVDLDRETTTDADPAFGCGTGYECSVTVTATDSAGEASDAKTVTIKLTNVDEKPTFVTETTATSPKTLMRGEGMTALDDTDLNVTYAATDPDDINVNLALMGPDGGKFSLDSDGVLSFRAKPDYEMPTDANRDNVYEVTVRASDGTLHEDRMVAVTVTDVDEAPEIIRGGLGISETAASREYAENGTDAVGTYTARGPEAASAGWTLEGDDAGQFRLSSSSGMSTMLMFRSAPNYEMPRGMAKSDTNTNTYMVTLKATDGTDIGTDTHDVTVMVTNEEEAGMVSLSSMTPVVGTELTATLTDPDMVMDDTVMWQWSKSMSMDGDFTDIDEATMMSYTPVEDDNGYYLRVTATYTDGYGDDSAMATTSSMVVTGLAISGEASNDYAENGTDAVGSYTAAGPMADMATWTVEGADAMYFSVSPAMGAMTDLMFKSAPDYEMPRAMAKSETNTNTYMVTLKASDGTEVGTDTHEVTVMVTNVDEDGKVTLSLMPPVVGAELTAMLTDLDGDVSGEAWQWSKSMTMDGEFTNIEDDADMASYTPVEADDGHYLRVTVIYTDGHGSGKEEMATTDNMVVTGLAISGAASKDYAENGTGAVGSYTAAGPTAASAMWTVEGADATHFSVSPEMGAMTDLMFSSPPDYEMPRGMAMSETNTNTYMVTLKATAGSGEDMVMDTHEVTVMVTNVDEDGVVMLDPMNLVVGNEVTATLTDPDGDVSGETWQWSKSMTMDGTFMDIDGATMKTYTPGEADDEHYLRAMAMYTDGHGAGKSAMKVSAYAVTSVTTGSALGDRYDKNRDGVLQVEEVYAAIDDYFDGTGITLDEVLAIINLYFDQGS